MIYKNIEGLDAIRSIMKVGLGLDMESWQR
jgi:hypothetical protein